MSIRIPPTRRGRQTRQALIDAAYSVFEERGMIDARITDITDAAGLSHAAFYRYFETKEEILKEVNDVAHRNVYDAVGTAEPAERELAPFVRFGRANRRYIQAMKENAEILRAVEQRLAIDPVFVDVSREMVESFVPRLERTLDQMQRDGRIDPACDARYSATALSAMVQRTSYVTFVLREGTAMRARVVRTVDMLWGNALGLDWTPDDLIPVEAEDATEPATGRPEPGLLETRTVPELATAKSAATAESLLAAARQVFERDGYLDARVSDITAAAGMSHGTFYNYFSDRLDALHAVAAELGNEMVAGLVDRPRDPNATLLDRITGGNVAFFEMYQRNARLLAVLEQVANIDAECAALRLGLRSWFIEHNRRAIEKWRDAGKIDERLDPAAAAEALCCMIERLAFEWYVLRVDIDPEEAARGVSEVWVRALGIDV